METWLPLTDYSSKYKISVSTLRRRIKAEDIKYNFHDGKYFIFDEPMKSSMKSGPSLNSPESELVFDDEILNDIELSSEAVEIDNPFKKPNVVKSSTSSTPAYNPDFLENLKRSANSRLPQVKMQQGALSQKSGALSQQQVVRSAKPVNIDEEYYFRKEQAPEGATEQVETSTLKEFSEKISKIGTNEPVLTAANKLLNELKKAYTQILHEKEEHMMLLKEEVSDLKTLVKALERENERLKIQNW